MVFKRISYNEYGEFQNRADPLYVGMFSCSVLFLLFCSYGFPVNSAFEKQENVKQHLYSANVHIWFKMMYDSLGKRS